MQKTAKHSVVAKSVFGTAVAVSWLAFIVYFPVTIGLLIWIGALLYLFIKRTKLKWWLLLVSAWTLVPLLSFMLGSKAYFQGKATIETVGLPGEEFYNLDPALRVWNSTSGCMVTGLEPFTQEPNNLAVRIWTMLLGTQQGVYKGIYPTREEAAGKVGQGELVRFSQAGDSIILEHEGQPLLLQVKRHDEQRIFQKANAAVLFVLNKECLLVQPIGDSVEKVVFLADWRDGKVFARYYDYAPVAALNKIKP